jgi:nucleoside-diphosphate-sugar epimerase
MRCVVTGCAGFVGSSIADRLLALGHEVVGIDSFVDYYPRKIKERNLKSAKESSKFSLIESCLTKLNLPEVLVGADVVFHQAAQAGVRASWGGTFSIYTDNNILSTQMLLEAAKSKEVSSSLKRIVYASSSSVYGSAETLPTTEATLPRPVSPYGVSKLAAEHLMELYRTEFGVPTVSLRYFTVYGPRQRPDMAFHRIIKAGLTGQQFTLFGDGEQSRDFTFIEDIVEANIAAINVKGADHVFNVGGGNRITMNKVILLIENTIGRKLNLTKELRAKGDASHTGADTSLAKVGLNYSPKVNLESGIEAEARWIDQMLKETIL